MRSPWHCSLALSCLAPLLLSGCGAPMQTCTIAYSITPISATLNHTVANNAQTYTFNVIVPPGCPLPPVHAPIWSVSNTTAATISQDGIASCKAAAATPITVSADFPGTTATLICK